MSVVGQLLLGPSPRLPPQTEPLDTIAYEAVTGPIATFTSQQQIAAFGQALGDPNLVAKFQGALNLVGEDCRNLNVNSYAVVAVDPVAGTASITMKDSNGAVVHDQLAASTACTAAIGP